MKDPDWSAHSPCLIKSLFFGNALYNMLQFLVDSEDPDQTGQSDITLDKNVFLNTVNVLKFHTPKVLTKWHMQHCRPRSDCSCRSIFRVYTVSFSTIYYKKQLHKKQNLAKSME